MFLYWKNVSFSNLLLKSLVGQTSEGYAEDIHCISKQSFIFDLSVSFLFFLNFVLVNQNIMILQLL